MNSVNLVGRITKDLELRYSTSGNAVTSFTVAVDRRRQKQGEEKKTDFIPCKAFGKTAELVSQYFSKGSQIGITGEIQTGSYEKDGVKHYTMDVIANQITFIGGKKESNNGNSNDGLFPEGEEDSEDTLPF